MTEPQEIIKQAYKVFADDMVIIPPTTLRSADAINNYDEPIPYDPNLDEPTDEYIEHFTYWGQIYLDPASWKYYLPKWIDYIFHHEEDKASMVTEGVIYSLRPPDREPPRLASLNKDQEAVIVSFLKHVAASGTLEYNGEMAQRVLEEWYLPNALFRPKAED